MNKQVFTVRSVSAALKGGRTGTAASLALIQIGFAPQEYSDSTCTSVPREGERFLRSMEIIRTGFSLIGQIVR